MLLQAFFLDKEQHDKAFVLRFLLRLGAYNFDILPPQEVWSE